MHRPLERAFDVWGRFVLRHRWSTLAASLLVAIGLASFLPEMRVENSAESYLHPDDPEIVRYNAFKDTFDRDDRVVIVVRPKALYDLGFLDRLRELHHALEKEVPFVEEVTSLLNARYIRGNEDELIVEDLLEIWPTEPADLDVLKRRVRSNPLYANVLVSQNEEHTVVSLKPFTYSTLGTEPSELAGFDDPAAPQPRSTGPLYLTEPEGNQLVEAVLEVMRRYDAPDFQLLVAGGPVNNHVLDRAMTRDVSVFLSAAVAIVAFLLFVLFRRISCVLLPLFVVSTSVASTMGAMVLLGISFSVGIQIVPAFLLVIGICYVVHLLVIFLQQFERGMGREDAILFAIRHSGVPILFSGLTTAAGLLSFCFAEILPIADLGIIAPIGVMLAMLYCLATLPALLAVTPLRRRTAHVDSALVSALQERLVRGADLAARHPRAVVAATAVLAILSLVGATRLQFSHDMLQWFPANDPLRIASETLDREFKGSSTLEVLVDTGRENGLTQPAVLRGIESAMRHTESLQLGAMRVSKTVSIVDLLKEIHRALSGDRPEFYVLPEDRSLVAQELFLFENSGSDDLEELVDSQFRVARLSLRTPWVDAVRYTRFIDLLEDQYPKVLGDGLSFSITGENAVWSRILKALIVSMARSYVFSLLVIIPLLVILIGSLRRGLVAILPNLAPILFVLGLMGWTGIPLDVSTLLIGSIVLGLAVDDTIHFMHGFNRNFAEVGDARRAIRLTMSTTGAAMLFTSLILSLGFSIFMLAYMQNWFWFGALLSSAMIVALIADVILGPALLILVTRTKPDRTAAT